MLLQDWVRPNILNLKPYSSARDEYFGEANVFLDANENPFNNPYNRYPDPLQRILKLKIADMNGVAPSNIFLGNGSDEPIDLLIRVFCEPALHNIVLMEPTYGMYQIAADIHNVKVIRVPLSRGYQLDAEKLLSEVLPSTRMIFLCSPNNPTGNALNQSEIEKVISGFDGPVVIDEAYIDFAPDLSFLPRLSGFENLIILQTFSKAWGMAGIRLGMAFANSGIIQILNKIKYPYNLNMLSQQIAMDLLAEKSKKEDWVKIILEERQKLAEGLKTLHFVEMVYPSDSNFLLVKMNNAKAIYNFLAANGIIVRDRSRILQCENCLRITIGNSEENTILLNALHNFIL